MKEFEKYHEKEGFKLPENYFDNFAHRMQEQIGEETSSTSWYEKLFSSLSFKWAAAALSIVVLSMVAYTNFYQTDFELSDEEIQAFLIDTENWDPADELFAQSDESYIADEFTDDELLDYLESDLSESEILTNYSY